MIHFIVHSNVQRVFYIGYNFYMLLVIFICVSTLQRIYKENKYIDLCMNLFYVSIHANQQNKISCSQQY